MSSQAQNFRVPQESAMQQQTSTKKEKKRSRRPMVSWTTNFFSALHALYSSSHCHFLMVRRLQVVVSGKVL